MATERRGGRIARIVQRHHSSTWSPLTTAIVEEARELKRDPLLACDRKWATRIDELNLEDGPGGSDLANTLPNLVVVARTDWRLAGYQVELPPAPHINLTPTEDQEQRRDDEENQLLTNLEASTDHDYTEADLLPLQEARERVRARSLVPDALAFYRSFAYLSPAECLAEPFTGPRWGIFLTTGGIERLAWSVFLECGLSVQEAIAAATTFLAGHEFGHFLVDITLAQADLRGRHGQRARSEPWTSRHAAACRNTCRLEEAFAQGYAVRFLKEGLVSLLGDTKRLEGAMDIIRRHVANGLPGYRRGADMDEMVMQPTYLARLVEHIGLGESAEDLALLADLNRAMITGEEVPVRFIVSPGSAYASQEWSIGYTHPLIDDAHIP